MKDILEYSVGIKAYITTNCDRTKYIENMNCALIPKITS